MNYVSFIQDKSRTKVTKFEAGVHVFVPDPLAVMTKFEIQAAGGNGGILPSVAAAGTSAGIMAGAGGGSFLSVMITEKIKLPSVRISVGGPKDFPAFVDPKTGVAGEKGDDSYIGSSRVGGGNGGGVAAVTAAAVSRTGGAGTGYTFKFEELGQWFELFRKDGGQSTAGYIPRSVDHSFIKGGDGGNSFWGVAGRSDYAIYSGVRTGYNTVSRDGYGYGFGACGRSYGNMNAYATGTKGGNGLTIVTEYF
jgi:hypothetical protein